jgi:DNA-binding transcriptional MerR regulator
MGNEAPASTDDGLRIGDVVHQTGLSKELVHHYLRLGLLPRAAVRGRYTQVHVDLAAHVRALREEHNLPLEDIRRIFEAFDFDPERLRAVSCSVSLLQRAVAFGRDGEVFPAELLPAEELAARADRPVSDLEELVAARVITPLVDGPPALFSSYDVDTLRLCDAGTSNGIPLSSFRTIASFVRIGVELERWQLFAPLSGDGSRKRVLADIFARREISTNFVVAVLQAAAHSTYMRLSEPLQPPEDHLDDLLYRPSAAFVQRHGLDHLIEQARADLAEQTEHPGPWLALAELQLHAGRPREAAFLLEESRTRWPDAPGLRHALGRALLLQGEVDRGIDELRQSSSPVARLLADVAAYRSAESGQHPTPTAAEVLGRTRDALAQARTGGRVERLQVAMLAGWLLGVLPPALGCSAEGRALLMGAWLELEDGALADFPLPGLAARLRINTSWLLLRQRADRPQPPVSDPAAPDRDTLIARICSLDPGCSFAEAAFLGDANRRST